jgi:hypothetical protein
MAPVVAILNQELNIARQAMYVKSNIEAVQHTLVEKHAITHLNNLAVSVV